MNNSPYITELLINEKLAASRAEGMRSQMQAREGINNHKRIALPNQYQFILRVFYRVYNYPARYIKQPHVRKLLAR